MLKVILQKIITISIAITFITSLGGSQTRAGKCSEQCNNLYLPLPLEPSARSQAVGNLRKCLGNCRKAKRGDGNSEG